MSVHTDTALHAPVTHGRGSYFISVNAELEITKRRKRGALWTWFCGPPGDKWSDWIEEEEDRDDIGSDVFAAGGDTDSVQLDITPRPDRAKVNRASEAGKGADTQTAAKVPKMRTRAVTRVQALSEGSCLLMTNLSQLPKLLRLSPNAYGAVHSVAALEKSILQLPFFYQKFSNTTRLLLRDLWSYRAVGSGQCIQSPDDSGEAFYIIIKGSVSVYDAGDGGRRLSVPRSHLTQEGRRTGSHLSAQEPRRFRPIKATYGEGQYFGGSSLFKDARSRPSGQIEVIATSKSLLACVSPLNFGRLLSVDQTLGRNLLQEAKRRLLHSFRAERIPFFCDMLDTTLNKYAELATFALMPAGGAIDTHTEDTKGLYVVAEGVVEAKLLLRSTATRGSSVHASKKVKLNFGDYFGELPLMLPSAPIGAHYYAGQDDVTLLVLSAPAFAHLFGKDQTLLAELRMRLHGKQTSLMTILEHPRARALFTEHLRKGGASQEARLHFYMAVTQFLQLEPSGFRAASRAIAEGIVKEYVPDYAIIKVEMSESIRTEMLQALRDGSTDKYPDLLRRAREDIYSQLERVSLRTFTSSEPFLRLLDTLSPGNGLDELKQELSDIEA